MGWSWRRIATIFRKDLRDAIRDARVLVALVIPLAIGLFYNATFDDSLGTAHADVAYFTPDGSQFPATLNATAGGNVDLRFFQAGSADEVAAEVKAKRADLGLVLPVGFDAAVKAGGRPELRVIEPATTGFASDYLQAAIEPALRALAGQTAPASLRVESVADQNESESAIDKVGLRRWSILASIITMIGMIAMLAVPVVLAEETEKKTLDALVLVASYPEVVAAKALLGLFYIAVMVPLLLGLTTTYPAKPALFAAAVFLLSLTLVGFGLLLAGLFKSANQLNTWSGLLLLPVIAPAFAVGLPIPHWVELVAVALPTGAATKIMMNGMSHQRVFSGDPGSFAVVAAWGVLAFGLLLWRLSRHQA